MFAADMMKDPERVVDVFLEIMQPYLANTKRISAVEASQLLLRAYLVRYGFTNEETLLQRPASLCAMHSAEDPFRGSLREDHMDHFVELKIGELFNITFDQYLARPRHELQLMRDKAESYRKKKNTAADNAVKEAESLLGKL